MMNLLGTKLFKLLHNSSSLEKELENEFYNFFNELRECYSSEKELYHALKEIQKGLVSLKLLKSKITHSKPCKRKKEHRLHFISSLKLLLEYEMEMLKYLFHNERYFLSNQVQPMYQWTGKKTDLIELAYTLYENQTINHGNIPIEKFTQDFAAFFGVNITNSSRMYFNIKQRKTESRTTFLDTLAKMLNKRMIKDDEK